MFLKKTHFADAAWESPQRALEVKVSLRNNVGLHDWILRLDERHSRWKCDWLKRLTSGGRMKIWESWRESNVKVKWSGERVKVRWKIAPRNCQGRWRQSFSTAAIDVKLVKVWLKSLSIGCRQTSEFSWRGVSASSHSRWRQILLVAERGTISKRTTEGWDLRECDWLDPEMAFNWVKPFWDRVP